jgi:hypothetical protein
MTSTTTPSLTSNSNAATSSSAPIGAGASSGIPAAHPLQMTRDHILAENARQVTNNVALQLLRDANNLNMGPDEPLLLVPAIPVVANGLQQWIATFINLSPNSQAQGAAVLKGIAGTTKTTTTTTRPPVSSVSKELFDSSKETASSSGLDSTYNFGIHHFIQDLANTGEYCPLTLFSNKNTEHLHQEGHSLKHTKVHVNGVSHHLLDLSQFENERDLDPLTWQEAFQRYLIWIGDVRDVQSLKRWTSHFTMLAKDEAIHKNFRAILEFDIKTRQNYALRPHQHDEAEWSHHLQKKKYATLQDKLFRHSQQLRSSFADCSSNAGPSACFEPYDNAAKRPAKKHDGDLSSFQDSKSGKLVDPMCIICGRTGHHFSACTEETSSKGAQNFAKYTDSNLCRCSNSAQLCIGFNLNNP